MRQFKFYYILFFLTCFSFKSYSQTEFGIKGGLNFTFFKVIEGDFGANQDTEIGFYAGAFADFDVKNSFHVQPELLLIAIGDFKFLNAPIYLKYDINNDLHILVGPSLNYFFDFFSNKFKVRADLGLDYDLSTTLSLSMKYTIGLEELSPNVVFLGLGYRL